MRILRIIAALLGATYGAILLATFIDPVLLEKQAESYLRDRLETEVRERVGVLKEGTASGLAGMLARNNVKEIQALEAELESRMDERLDAVMRMMRDPSCECRRYIERSVRKSVIGQIADLRIESGALQRIALEAYGEIVRNLQRDFRIFSGVSLIACLLIFLVSFLKPMACIHLVLPSALLIISTLVASWFYLFEQNWFFTILTNSYVGFSYLLWVSLIFGFLVDILLNKGRVTTQLINAAGNVLSGAFSAVPC